MNKMLHKMKQMQNTKLVKKSLTISMFTTGIIISILTQIVHCCFFYYCRAFFINILTYNTYTFFFDIEQYIIMIAFLVAYGICVNYVHKMLLYKYIKNHVKALLLEDILLGWKYFVFLIVFLIKLFLTTYWALLVYFAIISYILWRKNVNKVIIGVYSFLLFTHLCVLNSPLFYHLNGVFLLFYSSIYFTIFPCYNTIVRIRKITINEQV